MSQLSPYSNPLQSFNFGDLPIRVINQDGEPWFVGIDVCNALGISDAKQAIDRLDDDERGRYDVPTGGGIQSCTCISEPGLYTLILTSRKDSAKDFKRWITHEVIPAIRKTGAYLTQQLSPEEFLVMQATQLLEHKRRIEAVEQRQNELSARIEAQNEYFTVLAYCRLHHITLSNSQAIGYGRKCSTLSRQRGIPIGKATDPRVGEVGTYHQAVLDEVIRHIPMGELHA